MMIAAVTDSYNKLNTKNKILVHRMLYPWLCPHNLLLFTSSERFVYGETKFQDLP
jgi:hypothetical protein